MKSRASWSKSLDYVPRGGPANERCEARVLIETARNRQSSFPYLILYTLEDTKYCDLRIQTSIFGGNNGHL